MSAPGSPPPSDPAAARALAAYLASGENVLWAGRPDTRAFARVDPRLIGLGIFWTLVAGAGFYGFFANFLTDEFAGVALSARVLFLTIGAAPFLAVSVWALGGHVLLRRRLASRIAYAVTTERVMAARPTLGPFGAVRVRALLREQLGEPQVEVVRKEAGSIDFLDVRGVDDPVRFECVRGAAAVAALAAQRAPGT